MATAHSVDLPFDDAYTSIVESESGTDIIDSTMTALHDMRIDSVFFELPSACTYALKIQLPSGPLVSLSEGTTSTASSFAVAAGRAVPSGSIVSFLTDNPSGDKEMTALYSRV